MGLKPITSSTIDPPAKAGGNSFSCEDSWMWEIYLQNLIELPGLSCPVGGRNGKEVRALVQHYAQEWKVFPTEIFQSPKMTPSKWQSFARTFKSGGKRKKFIGLQPKKTQEWKILPLGGQVASGFSLLSNKQKTIFDSEKNLTYLYPKL